MVSFWTFVQVAPTPIQMSPIILGNQQIAQQRMELRMIVFRVEEGSTPEETALSGGLQGYMYCRPAIDKEIGMYYKEHPNEIDSDVPTQFLESDVLTEGT